MFNGSGAAAPGCGGQSCSGPGGGLQVGKLAPGCFSWEMGSLWAQVEREDQHSTASGSSPEEAAEHAGYPAVQPCVWRGSWPVVGVRGISVSRILSAEDGRQTCAEIGELKLL